MVIGAMRSPAELTTMFRQRGLRITPQRVAVFEALHERPDHPSAESVFQAVSADMPSISLRTVYQTLNDLTEMGEIRRLDLGGDAARFDPNTGDHHHLVCDECGRITDAYFDVDGIELGGLTGFTPVATKVVVTGVCDACALAGSTADPSRNPTTSTTTTTITNIQATPEESP